MPKPKRPNPDLAGATYDVSKVPGVLCLQCKQPIGDLPFVEVRMFERFGKMMFEHKECPVAK